MYLDNRTNPIESDLIEFQAPKINVIFFDSGPKFTEFVLSNVEKIVVANAVFRWWIA